MAGRRQSPSWRGCRVQAPALPSRPWPWRGDRRESPPPTLGCSSFRGRARQPAAPPQGRWGHCPSLGLPSTHAGLFVPGWHQRVSRGFSWGLDAGPWRAEEMTCTCASHTRRAEGSTWQQERALLRTAHPPVFPVFFFASWLCQQTVTKSWPNGAEPLAPGGLSPRETHQCLLAGCGWEISLGAGDGAASAVSLIQGFLQAAQFPGVLVFSRRSVEKSISKLLFRNNFARCATGACQRERRWFCQEVAEKELGRLQLARLASAVLSFPSSPGLSSLGLLSTISWGS